jgi:methylase of polypeptide subunit release factors
MNLVPLDVSRELAKTDTRMDIVLQSGIKMRSQFHLSGGGQYFKDDFIRILKEHGKEKYSRGFEWCCGFGIIGYEVLGLGIANHMAFSDYYDNAIYDINDTAKNNNIENCVSSYITPTISGIPDNEIWDLVIGNPPHAFSDIETSRQSLAPSSTVDDTLRTLVDDGMEIHKEFFMSIRKHLTDNADVIIYEPEFWFYENIFKEMADAGGLYIYGAYPVIEALQVLAPLNLDIIHKNGRIVHFKVKKENHE